MNAGRSGKVELKSNRIALSDGIFLNIVETDKFKSNLLTVNFIRPLDKAEVTMNALLPMVLERGSKSFPTKLLMERKLEQLYGASLDLGSSKRGERQLVKASIEWADSKFTSDKKSGKEAINLLKGVLFDPVIIDGSFDDRYVEQEKRILISRIRSRINDKRNYAISRCIEEMCKGERFGIYSLGYEEDVEGIDGKRLYEQYRNILMTSPIEIFFVGNLHGLELDQLIPAELYNRRDILLIPREVIPENNLSKRNVEEAMSVSQGKLVLGFRSSIPYEHELYNGLLVGNELLGGGPNSHMFKTVREEKSLAYYASSRLIKHKSIILADAGIQFSNYKQALDLILDQVARLKSGDFSDEDLQIAKKSIENSSRSIVDSNQMISEFFLGKVISNDERSLEDMLSELGKTDRDKVIIAMDTVTLDTIYFLNGKEGETDEENLE
jgi:predicted Zn-dependent peptidase